MKKWQEIITDAQVLLGISNITATPNASDNEKMSTCFEPLLLTYRQKAYCLVLD